MTAEEPKLKILAPCEDCIHDSLCVIKANLAFAGPATLTMPPNVPEIHPRYSEQLFVDCDSYVDAGEYAAFLARREKARDAGRKSAKVRQLHTAAPRVTSPPVPAVDVTDGWAPLCMDDAEWADWQRLNPRQAEGGRAERPCADCPATYAAEMRDAGTCNGTPAVAA